MSSTKVRAPSVCLARYRVAAGSLERRQALWSDGGSGAGRCEVVCVPAVANVAAQLEGVLVSSDASLPQARATCGYSRVPGDITAVAACACTS